MLVNSNKQIYAGFKAKVTYNRQGTFKVIQVKVMKITSNISYISVWILRNLFGHKFSLIGTNSMDEQSMINGRHPL